MDYVKKYQTSLPPEKEGSREEAFGYVTSNLKPEMMAKINVKDLKDWVDSSWRSKGDIQAGQQKQQELGIKRSQADQSGTGKPKDNKSEYIRIREATNSLIERGFDPGEDSATNMTIAKNVVILKLLAEDSTLGVQEADQQAVAIVDKMEDEQYAELLSSLKGKKNIDHPGTWSKIKKAIGGVSGFFGFGSDESPAPTESTGRSGVGVPTQQPQAQPAAQPQTTTGAPLTPEEIEEAKRALASPKVSENTKIEVRKKLEGMGVRL